MGKFFDIDGSVFKWMTRIADFILLDLLMIIFSIPIITAGPALTAVYYVALKEVRDEEGYLWKGFWKAFKLNFRQGILLELILAAAAAFLYMDISMAYDWAMESGSFGVRLVFFVILGVILIVIAIAIYIFPMLSKFESKIWALIKNSLLMSVKHLPQTFVMMIATGIFAYLTLMYIPLILLSVGIVAYINSYILVRVFDLYIPKNEEGDPDEFHVDMSDIDNEKETNNIEDDNPADIK